jgi:hypothetical protein
MSGGARTRPIIDQDGGHDGSSPRLRPAPHAVQCCPCPLPTLADLKALHPAQVGQQLIDNPLMIIGLTIIGTSVGAVALRWVLHRAINRVVTGALTRAAAHASQTPRRTSRVLAQATGLDEA